MASRRRLIVLATLLMVFAYWSANDRASAQEARVNSIAEMFARLKQCWKSPTLQAGDPGMQITVLLSFKRNGEILGRPRITFESETASDDERIIYRTAVMETLQRCAPMPFTDSMGGAIAGRPLTMRFDDRRNSSQPKEKRAWLTTTTL
ncbi:MAG: hypothetical protein JSS22_12435 [Proteobacteria bacterium]|nr:hypothetical protein [Pseudomonadota bacterium]